MEGHQPRRRLQLVSSKADRKKVITWMMENQCENIASAAVDQFPEIFSQRSRETNRAKAGQWWRDRVLIMAKLQTPLNKRLHVTTRRANGVFQKQFPVKAFVGRGRKRAEWTEILHQAMINEFERVRRLGVKVNGHFIQEMALVLLQNENVPVSVADVQAATGKLIADVITKRWVQNFKDRFNIVCRARTGKTSLSAGKIIYYKKRMAYLLGTIKREYDEGLDENDVENLDETHMIFDMDNGRVLDFSGKKRVTYQEISAGGQGFTVVVRISARNGGRIEVPMVIFMNKDRSYPIGGVPDDVDGVFYRSSPKGWMDQPLFAEYFREERTITALPDERIRRVYVDRCKVHEETEYLLEALHDIRTNIVRFPANCTHLIQPLDQILLRMLKAAWRRMWEQYRAEMVQQGIFTSTGRVPNPGKHFYLEMVRDVVDEINEKIDAESGLKEYFNGLIPEED